MFFACLVLIVPFCRYKDPPLVDLIDKLDVTEKDLTRPARFFITEVLGRGDVPGVSGLGLAGKVEGGIIAVGKIIGLDEGS